ncbi:MAG: bacteriohemerythrin [Chloroflexi bacterium]|nr:bacteriohemerythrin [Chloroflexota bacterium]
MSIMSWSESYSVGSLGIDAQHKKLFDLVNELHDAMSQGKGKEILGATLDKLVNYSKEHFAIEEKMLANVNYPDLPTQKLEHAAFIQKVFELQTQYRSGKVALTLPVMEFLKDWLVNHIIKNDQKYMAYVK